MGIGFTIDTPLRLAPLGIDSSISLVSDSVIEEARAYHSRQRLIPYVAIEENSPDARGQRITAYLNLVNTLVQRETKKLRSSSFEDPQGIRRFFELLPSESAKRKRFVEVQSMCPGQAQVAAQNALRQLLVPGTIGVNIMTKVDGNKDKKGVDRGKHNSEAQSALRGFALSDLSGPLILSAGANPGLFAYLAEFDDFFPDEEGFTKKKIILKVSDFRSAHVQGRMLARRGLWISEYRIESGLNCGGHAFPTEGLLMGPILREFAERRIELEEGLFAAYSKGLHKRGLRCPAESPPVKITAQGGVGTHAEAELLRQEYGIDGTGWGSPFLMVPEAVTLDRRTLTSLENASAHDVQLSWSSPLGVRFWWLKTSESETTRQDRIEQGYPGSVCTLRHLALNSEYGDIPLCVGSRAYQRKKKAELNRNDPEYDLKVERLEAPACICVDLSGSFLSCTNAQKAPPAAICPGPNIVNFQKERTLQEMVDHIYGRANIISARQRPHFFIREVELYFEVFRDDLKTLGTSLQTKSHKQLVNTLNELAKGLMYYEEILDRIGTQDQHQFAKGVAQLLGVLETSRLALASVSQEKHSSQTLLAMAQ